MLHMPAKTKVDGARPVLAIAAPNSLSALSDPCTTLRLPHQAEEYVLAAYLTRLPSIILSPIPHVSPSSMAMKRLPLDDFLGPLHVDVSKIHSLARSFCRTYTKLAAESQDQFLSTPISDSILRPSGNEKGR
jgi:hypothetical protein